jgi:hypothetical protein
MKRIQNFYLYSYRLIGFVFLLALISSILWYGFSMLFFIANSSWSVPLILSPNQEKVMMHLEHVLASEHQVTKNLAELTTFTKALEHKKLLLKTAQKLQVRVNQSMLLQSQQDTKNSRMFKTLSKEKTASIAELNQLLSKINLREAMIEKELQAGLITKQEALSAHLSSSKVRSDLVDARASLHDLNRRAQDFSNAANTLNGAANNLLAMNKVIKKVELENQIAQLKNDIFSLTISTEQLKTNVEKRNQVLIQMKNSPYILATRQPTTVAFVPYRNLTHAKVGAPVYSCWLDMVLCYKSGHISRVYKAEEYSKHPIFKSDIKGQLIGIVFNHKSDGQKKLLFLNSKPLLL